MQIDQVEAERVLETELGCAAEETEPINPPEDSSPGRPTRNKQSTRQADYEYT